MSKKTYQQPDVRMVMLCASTILAGSTGATGEDIPWASAKERVFSLGLDDVQDSYCNDDKD